MYGAFFMLFFFAIFGAALLIYVVPVAALIGFVRFLLRNVRRIRAIQTNRPMLARVASELGLEMHKNGFLFGDELTGVVGGFRVTIDTPIGTRERVRWNQAVGVRIRLRTKRELPHRLALSSRGTPLAEVGPIGKPIRTFDTVFDQDFLVYGRAVDAAARLDANLRRRLIELDARAEIYAEDDLIVLVTRRCPTPSMLVHLLHLVASLGHDLTDDGPSAPDRLLANAMSDPNIAVRYQNLDLLLRTFPATDQATQGLRLAWDAPERGIRFLAAIRNGEAALPFLEETAQIVSEPQNLRVMTLRYLARHGVRESLLPILHRAVRDPASLVAKTAIELLGGLHDRTAVPLLIGLVARAPEDEALKVAVAQALGNIGDPAAESFLLTLLPDDLLAVKIVAASALGKAGTSASLRSLSRIVQRYVAVKELADTARAAIVRIEMRNGPAERGQLSLVEVPLLQGALSLPQASGGELSVPRRTGAVSMAPVERKPA